MNSCSTCKWWERHKKQPVCVMRDGVEVVEEVGDTFMGQCSMPKLNLGYNEIWAGHEYSNRDGMWQAGAPESWKLPTTGEDFGCIHWRENIPHETAAPASCRNCKHWSEQQEGFGTCGNADTRELLRVLGGYMLCHASYGCVMHEPNTKPCDS